MIAGDGDSRGGGGSRLLRGGEQRGPLRAVLGQLLRRVLANLGERRERAGDDARV